jgi:hypothetical protein
MSGALKIAIDKRGHRFAGDKKTIPLFYERSKNGNLVVFDIKTQSSPEHGGKRLHPADTIDAYWLDLEPSYQAKARANGKKDDREELNFVERWQAYGAKAENVEPLRADVSFVGLPSKKMVLTLEKLDGEQYPVLRCAVGNTQNCIIEKVYVQSDESGWIPKVKHVDIHGYDPNTGAAVTERITP